MDSKSDLRANINEIKKLAIEFANQSSAKRNDLLLNFAAALTTSADLILEANARDLEASKSCLPESLLARLKLDKNKLQQLRSGIEDIAKLKDPLNQAQIKRVLDDGLLLEKRTVPLGLVAFVFESRPDVLPQILSLCIKSGNGLIFKGGYEAEQTLATIYSILADSFRSSSMSGGLPVLQLFTREEFQTILEFNDLIDLVIPRGSNTLVQNIMSSSRIPVLGHADGVCHIYVAKSANLALAKEVILDSKTQYPAACNAVEVLLVNSAVAPSLLPDLCESLSQRSVQLYGCDRVLKVLPNIKLFNSQDWHVEYSDLTLAIKIVNTDEEAIEHINTHGSHHTDCVIAEDSSLADLFVSKVDSADVFVNCSTRFADGYRFGFGAEVGISTSKLHARGPVGLDGLYTYKYILRGSGHTVAPYVNGDKKFKHHDL